MNFYIYDSNVELGTERLGTEGKHVLHNCTMRKVKNITKNMQSYSVYSFTNFYDDKTFKLIERK